MRAARLSRGRLPEDLLDALAQPIEAARLDGLGEPGSHDEHVVLVLRQLGQARAEGLAQAPLHLVSHHRRAHGFGDREAKPGFGLNAESGEYEDLFAGGITDPTMVVRSALQNAASIAKSILTTECIVAEAPEKERMGAGMPGGMPDMM